MEKLSILAMMFAIPAICFMLVANVTGKNKWIVWLFIKLPSLISLVTIIVYGLKFLRLI